MNKRNIKKGILVYNRNDEDLKIEVKLYYQENFRNTIIKDLVQGEEISQILLLILYIK